MNIAAQQQRIAEQQNAVEASALALNEAVDRMARGLKIDAELIQAIANLATAVSMLVVEPVHQRMDEAIDAEHVDEDA